MALNNTTLDFSKYYKSINVVETRTNMHGYIQVGQLIAKEYSDRKGFYGFLLYGKKAIDPATGKEFRKGLRYAPSHFRPCTLEDVEILEGYLKELEGKIKKDKSPNRQHPWIGATEDIIACAMIRQMLKAYCYEMYLQKSHEYADLYGKNSPQWNRAIKPFTDYTSIDRMPKGLTERPF